MEKLTHETCRNYDLRIFLKEKGWFAIPLTKHSIYKVGHHYWCSYWSKHYEVLAVEFVQPYNRLKSVTVKWDDDRIATHCTTLEARDYELVLA